MANETTRLRHIRGDDYIESPHEIFVLGNQTNKPLILQIKSEEYNQFAAPLITKKNGLAGGDDSQIKAESFDGTLTKVILYISDQNTEALERGKYYAEIFNSKNTVSQFTFELLGDLISENLEELPPPAQEFAKFEIAEIDKDNIYPGDLLKNVIVEGKRKIQGETYQKASDFEIDDVIRVVVDGLGGKKFVGVQLS